MPSQQALYQEHSHRQQQHHPELIHNICDWCSVYMLCVSKILYVAISHLCMGLLDEWV